MKLEKTILTELIEYNRNGSYPWHMPGHKRRMQTIFPELVDNPFSIDMTEIEGLDEFHHPEGIIKNAFEKAAKVYGSDVSFYLINGATCGILAAISAVCKAGDQIIVARNCHTSVYHAIELLHLKPVYVLPDWNEELQMFGGVKPERIKKAIKHNPLAKAVFIVSPTYEGVVSDVDKIAKIAHKNKMPLIVDEAHGAHFEYMTNVNEAISTTNYKELPLPAIKESADLVIESLHKTLPAMTQCAIMHVKSNLVDLSRLKEFLSIYQSTSPSYVFMATMEACIEKMDHERDGLFIIYKELLTEYRKKFSELNYIHLVDFSDFKRFWAKSYDIGKLVFSVANCGIKKDDKIVPFTGKMLGQILDEEYGQIVEMMADDYVIAMTSIADTKEAFQMLFEAVSLIDHELIDLSSCADMYNVTRIPYDSLPECKMDIGTAMDMKKKVIHLFEANGKISGDYVYVYPPGIPIVTPGEVLTGNIIQKIYESVAGNLNVKGIIIDETKNKEDESWLKISVIDDSKHYLKKKLFNRR
ncbi:MAG: aminotransferase class I/II-fold pyridoxal phosphate-dependent enzyme [Lachnospiraceae bacterium]